MNDRLVPYAVAVIQVLNELSITDRLTILEKLGKDWRRKNSYDIAQEVQQSRRIVAELLKQQDAQKNQDRA